MNLQEKDESVRLKNKLYYLRSSKVWDRLVRGINLYREHTYVYTYFDLLLYI